MTDTTRTLAAAMLGLLAASGPAFAHAHLKSATPTINGHVTATPAELDLVFSEGLNLKFTGAKLIGSDKKPVATGEASLGAGSDSILVVPVPAPLSPGSYTVEWHALSNDGHKTSGTYTFTLTP